MENSGFASTAKIDNMIFQEMGLCGIFSPEKYPQVTELVENLFHDLRYSSTLLTIKKLQKSNNYI